MVVDESVVPEILSLLEPQDFASPSCREVFQAVRDLRERGEPVDLVTVSSLLKGVSAADVAVWAETALPSQAVRHAEIVKRAASNRALRSALLAAAEALDGPGLDGSEAVAELARKLSAYQASAGRSGFEPVSAALTKALKEIEREDTRPALVPTGFAALDGRLGGVRRGELWIVAGRPGMGKTALSQAIALNVAEHGHGVAFVTAEMSAAQLAQRMLARETKIENRDLRRGKLAEHEIWAVVDAAQRLGKLPLHLLEVERTWSRITAQIRALKLKLPELALIVVDYVGLLKVPSTRERYLELGTISADAKALALELDVAVILVSQLNRDPESRDDKRPRLSDLRESGNLEQDADVVALLFRPGYYERTADPKLCEIDIVKNRHGPTGLVRLIFDPATVSFSDEVQAC